MLKEKIIEIKALLEAGWCQGEMAKDKDGHTVPTHSSEATCFCLVGAMTEVCNSDYEQVYNHLKAFMPDRYGWLTEFNDNTDKKSVMDLLDKALEAA